MARFGPQVDPAPQYGLRKRFFTLAEANRALVLVKRVVADVVTEYSRLLDLQETVDAAEADEDNARADDTRRELSATAEKLRVYLEELDDVGVTLADWSIGMVDFPSIVDGREIQLSWQYGDSQINYWHETHGAPRGRKPIDTLLGPAVVSGG